MSAPTSRLEFSCTKCTGSALISKHLSKVPILQLCCLECRSTFYQCIFCPIGANGLSPYRHYIRFHVTTGPHIANVVQYRLATATPRIEYNDNDTDSLSSDTILDPITSCHQYIECIKQATIEPTSHQIFSMYPNQSSYFEAFLTGHGGNYVVEQAISNGSEPYTDRSHSSTLFMLVLSYFSSRLSKNQGILFSSLMAYVKANPNDESLFIPSREKDIRRVITEGANSIYTLLPTSPIDEYDGDVVYIPMKDTITRLFSRKSKLPNIFLPVTDSSHGDSPRGHELLNPLLPDLREGSEAQIYPLKLILWTDAFQCFNVSVNSEASAHTCTATVGALDGDHSGAFSFPVWLSKKSSDRDILERRLVDEINELSDNSFPVYHAGIKRIVNVQLKLYTFLCDRPDKSSSLSMLSSKYCARFGYAGDLSKVIDHVVCCTECYSSLVRNEPPSNDCDGCFCFDFSQIHYPKHRFYPSNIVLEDNLLPMKKLVFSEMSRAVKYCFSQVRAGKWSKQSGMEYLRTEGIDTSLSKLCVDNGTFANLYLFRKNRHPREQRYREDDQKLHPSDYELPSLPPLWSINEHVDIAIFIDAYMHLLFLGVQKALSSGLISRYLTPQRKLQSYIKTLNIKLGYIHALKASYMPIHKSCGATKLNFGGCLSRHWLSICRLTKWLFSHICICHPVLEESTNTPPDHFDFIRYNPGQIRHFCHSRGIPVMDASSSAIRIQEWFSDVMESPTNSFAHYTDNDIITFIKEQCPMEFESVSDFDDVDNRRREFFLYVYRKELIPPIRSNFSNNQSEEQDELITDVIVLYHSFVGRVMGSCTPESVDRHAKAFLTAVHKLDNSLNGSINNNPMILDKVNFLTLLNASHAIRRFGSARSLWEGGAMGEGSIPRLKQRIHHMKPGFARNAINSFLDKECIIDLIEHSIGNIMETTTDIDPSSIELENLMAAGATIRRDGGDDIEYVDRSLFGKNDSIRDCFDNLVGHVTHPPKSVDPISLSHQVIEICVVKATHKVYLLDMDKLELVNIFVRSNPVTVFGAQYFSMSYSSTRIRHTEISKDDIVCGLMLRHASMTNFYHVVAMNWTELCVIENGEINFVPPRCPSFTYST